MEVVAWLTRAAVPRRPDHGPGMATLMTAMNLCLVKSPLGGASALWSSWPLTGGALVRCPLPGRRVGPAARSGEIDPVRLRARGAAPCHHPRAASTVGTADRSRAPGSPRAVWSGMPGPRCAVDNAGSTYAQESNTTITRSCPSWRATIQLATTTGDTAA